MLIVTKGYKLINNIYNKIYLKLKKVKFDNTLKINGKLKILGTGNNLYIDKNVTINSGKRANPIGGDTRTILSGNIKIGKNVGISNSTLIAQNEIIIEDSVMIGGGTKIYDTDFHSINFYDRMKKLDNNVKTKKIHIKSGAFIGAHSIILKGVTIGNNSVIGAGSVVTKDIPNNEIWGGNPVRYIKTIE